MYRILIIDDEPVVREGISRTIDWNTHGFELVAACRDGREGIAALETYRPDVVITDICMPFVDGLELASWIGEEYPSIRTVLLTGYDEFEYAQEAVRLHVSDFLLKPITADELRTVLDRIHGELDDERRRTNEINRIRTQLAESLPLLRERFLNRLIRGPLPADERTHRLAILDISLRGDACVALVCDRDAPQVEEELTVVAISEEIESVLGGDAVVFVTPADTIVVIISDESPSAAAASALRCAERISRRIRRKLGRSISIGVGEPVAALEDISQSYRDARTALDRRLVLGTDQIITVEVARGGTVQPVPPDQSVLRERYVRAIRTGNTPEAGGALGALFALFRDSQAPHDACHVGVQRLLADTLNAFEALGIVYEQIPGLASNPFERLGAIKTLEDMERWFLDLEKNARTLLDTRRDEHSRRKALEAQEFIQNHYAEKDLSLTVVCSALSVSKSYLSPVFKTHNGMTFIEYLTEIRMERARELLAHRDLKTYEVAERVGYRNAHYFSLTFRKQTGYSPTEYRDVVGREMRSR